MATKEPDSRPLRDGGVLAQNRRLREFGGAGIPEPKSFKPARGEILAVFEPFGLEWVAMVGNAVVFLTTACVSA